MKREPRTFLEYLRRRKSDARIKLEKLKRLYDRQANGYEDSFSDDDLKQFFQADRENDVIGSILGKYKAFQGKDRIRTAIEKINKTKGKSYVKGVQRPVRSVPVLKKQNSIRGKKKGNN
jgi:hypothetical protein